MFHVPPLHLRFDLSRTRQISLSFLRSRSFSSLHLGTDSFNGAFCRVCTRAYYPIVWRGAILIEVCRVDRWRRARVSQEIERGGERARCLVMVWEIFFNCLSLANIREYWGIFYNYRTLTRRSLLQNRFNEEEDACNTRAISITCV